MPLVTITQCSIFLLCTAIGLTACKPTYAPQTMTPQETQYTTAILADMIPRCVGRYIMDLPKDFVLNSESSMIVKGVQVRVQPMTQSTFEAGFLNLKEKYQSIKLPVSKLPYLETVLPLKDSTVGGIFNRAKGSYTSSRVSRVLELKAWKSGYQITAEIEAINGNYPERANDPAIVRLGNTTAEQLATLNSVYERVRGRADKEIPTDAGICFANGFIKGVASSDDQDSMQLAYQLEGTRDVFFSLKSLTTVVEKDTMLQRSSKIESGMKQAGLQTIRKGERDLKSIKVEEWLMKGPADDELVGMSFQMRANETAEDVNKPFFDVTFKTAKRIPHRDKADMKDEEITRLGLNNILSKVGLSEEQAVVIWDKVISTLRPR